MNMKRIVFAGIVTVIGVLVVWISWSNGQRHGFARGYAQGIRDEFQNWKIEPVDLGPEWDGSVKGQRDVKGHAGMTVITASGGFGNHNGMTLPPTILPVSKP
jgi:hypothetical protein